MSKKNLKTLTIFRHAKSSWSDAGLADHDRPLNKRGLRDAPNMASQLERLGIRPSLILSSSAKRTKQTAHLVADAINYPREFLHTDQRLYLADTDRLLTVIAEQDERFNNLLLIAHNPGLTQLANMLQNGITDNLPTAGFVTVALNSETWEIRGANSIELIAYEYPKKYETRD